MTRSAARDRLICGIDGSLHARVAIDMACSLSRGLDLDLALVAVNRTRAAGGYPDLRDWSDEEAKAILRGAEDQAKANGLAPQLVLTEGRDIAQALLAVAGSLAGVHIVVGTGDPKGLGRLLLGSVAADVAEQAKVSVTIARAG